MKIKDTLQKKIPMILTVIIGLIFIISLTRGRNIVIRSEKEFAHRTQSSEAKTKQYKLQEIDATTGLIRWSLEADQGQTENVLEAVNIQNINAKLYYKNEVAFELFAPSGKADSVSKDIYLFGGVIAQNPKGDFKLVSERIDISNRGGLKTDNEFNLILEGRGSIVGKEAKISEDQSLITVGRLDRANLQNIVLIGTDVEIIRDRNSGDVKSATLNKGGKVLLKRKNNNSLTAGNIIWEKDGIIQAHSNVQYVSKDSTLTANSIMIDKKGKLSAHDNVKITYGETICKGNKLEYKNSSTVEISGGRPEAIQNGKKISAEKIVYNTISGKVEATGNVRIISTPNKV